MDEQQRVQALQAELEKILVDGASSFYFFMKWDTTEKKITFEELKALLKERSNALATALAMGGIENVG